MIYILVQDSYATVFSVKAAAELFHYIEGGELFSVESPYPVQFWHLKNLRSIFYSH